MYVEKDLEKIKKKAELRRDENFEFRSYLKWIDMESAEIDSVVHRIYNEVIEQIDCKECANCCFTKTPFLDDKDIKRFVRSLEIQEEEFRNKYLQEAESDDSKKLYEFNSLPCPFLKNNLCTNYDNRPENCQSFPHLHKNNFTSRLRGIINNCETCPIVFNVLEELKREFWRRRKGS
ncbi:MAG TPA: YkgJ family cysteine cluster protein [Ignavibacteriales bacterium]|nr:YkgJ family cysteine cluster protein [Ignavibacteriales bacterium]